MVLTSCMATQVFAQAAGAKVTSPGAHASAAGKIGAAAVWQPPRDFLANAHAACDKTAGPASYGECFIHQMSVAGASTDAVNFTRMLYRQSNGQVGIMSMFKTFSAVDAAQVFYPLRANDNYGLLLVNGNPEVLDVDDLKEIRVDQAALKQDPMFQAITHQFPKVDIFPGDRSSGSEPWPRVATVSQRRSAVCRVLPAAERMPCVRAFGPGAIWLGFRRQRQVSANHAYSHTSAAEAPDAAARRRQRLRLSTQQPGQPQPQVPQNPQ